MKKLIFPIVGTLAVFLSNPWNPALAGDPAALIPMPCEVRWAPGTFTLTPSTVIVADEAFSREAQFLADALRPATGWMLPVKTAAESPAQNAILLGRLTTTELPPPGTYGLSVMESGAAIRACDADGLFNGIQTFLQLLPPRICAKTPQAGVKWTAPCVTINDNPGRGQWRGFMLDESRHFFGAEFVKSTLDLMAMYKLNEFHWHLSDDDGWRIEIKSYPKLTSVGAWRGTKCALPNTRMGETHERYGGFYTQDQIRDIVAYATARHITIVPELDVPGHSRAAVVSYPEIACEGGDTSKSVQGVQGNVWCAGREENFKMLDAVFGELASLFPGPVIHIGGDEVNHNAWKACPRCQELIKRLDMKGVGQIQNYFVHRVEEIVRKHGKHMLGWNEIFNEGLAKDSMIVAWIGAGPGYNAAKRGWDVVMAPGPNCYFDMKESGRDALGHWWAGVVSLPQVYSFRPWDEPGLTPEQLGHIRGVQGAIWTEFAPSYTNVEYKIWPRLLALSEVAWGMNKDFTNFMSRLGPSHLERLAARGVNYRMPDPSAEVRDGKIVAIPPFPGAEVRYTTDGSEPTRQSTLWTGAPVEAKAGSFVVKAFGPGGRESHAIKGAGFTVNRKDALTPKATVTSTMNAYGGNKAENIIDWKPGSFFWSDRNGKAGDKVTIVLDEPVVVSSIEMLSGKVGNATEDCIVDGTLSVSTDGTTFTKAAQFQYGRAAADLKAVKIKALRIELNADHSTWIVLQDPILKK